MSTAKAAVFTGVNQPFEIREYPVLKPPAGMARIGLIASGVCGTDLHIHKGKIAIPPPKVIGHEFVGRVEALAPEDGEKYSVSAGDNVIVDIACPCGQCALCRDGDDANCLHLQVTNGGDPGEAPHFWGGYAEVNYSPVENLVKIPSGIDPKMACVFACAGPTTLHAFRLAERANCRFQRSDLAVVQGFGPVGAFAVLYLRALGIENIVTITGRERGEREKLIRKLGATEVFALDKTPFEKIAARIAEISGGAGADLVFEASGNPNAVPQGMELLRNRGVYLIPGQYSNSGGVQIAPQMITFKALHIIGSSQYSVADVKDYLAFLKKNPHLHADILALATGYPVSQINRAIGDADRGRNIKTMLVIQ